ncbi:MAG: ABC transporter permease [Planctomycetota bacterium]|jgi:ABC-type Na+ efflux pump permease subunit
MNKIFVVAMREYLAAVKTKAFILSVIMIPLLYGVGFTLPALLRDKIDVTDKTVAVIDETGELFDILQQASQFRNENEIFDSGEERAQVKPRFLLKGIDPTSMEGDPEFKLSEGVRQGEYLAFMVIAADVFHPQDSDAPPVRYHSNSPTYRDFTNWVRGPLRRAVQARRFAEAQLDPELVKMATAPISLRNLGLVSLDDSGNVVEAKESSFTASFLIAFGMLMLMFMTIMIGASPLLQSVLEEKMQRIAEVLLASVTPFQLMLGKLLGILGVSLTLSTLYLTGAYIALRQAGFADNLPLVTVLWFMLFQVLAVLMFGSCFAAVGAAVTDMKEAQSMISPMMFLTVMPMFFLQLVVREPMSALSTILSFIPPMTPMVMIVRLTVPPGIPLWQPIVGVILVLLTSFFCIFAAGRIFRVGILMQGKGANISEMLRWIVRG